MNRKMLTINELLIEFAGLDDGEFRIAEHATFRQTSDLVAEDCEAEFLITAKPETTAILQSRKLVPSTVGIIEVHGIPTPRCVESIMTLIGNRRSWYFGDCDPASIAVFLAISCQLPKKHQVRYLGISESFIAERCITIADWMWMEISTSESCFLPLLQGKYIQQIDVMLGSGFLLSLIEGRKLELESLLHI